MPPVKPKNDLRARARELRLENWAVNDIALCGPVKESLDAVARAVDDDIKRHNGYRP